MNREIPPRSGLDSTESHSFYWFKHGCCVPTTSVLWMMLTLFLFAVMTLIFCCFAMFFVRWVYQRQIRKKSDSLRKRYKSEEDRRRESELRLREVALRPIQMMQLQRDRYGEERHGGQHQLMDQIRPFPETPQPLADSQRQASQHVSDATPRNVKEQPERSLASQVPLAPTDGMETKAPVMFTGTTPLDSSGHADKPVPRTGISDKAGKNIEEVPMEPYDVAATVHAVAKGGNLRKSHPAIQDIVLVRKKPPSECTSDIMVPPECSSSQKTEERIDSTASGTMSAPNSSTAPSSKMETSKTGVHRTSSEKKRLAGDMGSSTTGRQEDNEPKAGCSFAPARTLAKGYVPPPRPYFPYWTAHRFVSTKVESNASLSGQPTGTKLALSERSFWMPTGSGATASSHCTRGSVCQPRVTDGKDLTKPHQKHHGITEERMPPRDVYQLRRELERMRANEISKGVQEILKESRGKQQQRERALLVSESRTKEVSPPQQSSVDMRPADNDWPTSNFTAFPLLKASIKQQTGAITTTDFDSRSASAASKPLT